MAGSTILQPEKGYRAGIDAVFLAASIPCASGESLFEAGIGTGVAALCVAARVPQVHITGVEVASRYAMLAEENAKRNGFGKSIRVIHSDVKEALRRDLSSMPAHGSFNHGFANPPYFEQDKVTPSPNLLKSQAHAFGPEDLDLWVKVLHTMVTLRGTVTFIHRPETLGTPAQRHGKPLRRHPCRPALCPRGHRGLARHRPGHQGLQGADAAPARTDLAWTGQPVHARSRGHSALRHGLAACAEANRGLVAAMRDTYLLTR